MIINFDVDTPIFQQVADELSNGIMIGAFLEEEKVPSVADLAVMLKINPATALKGINILVDDGILYKKRGLGMFVSTGAKEKLFAQRKENFYSKYIKEVLAEGERLNISKEEIASMILGGKKDE